MTVLTAVTALLLLAATGTPSPELPPLECLDAAGVVQPDAASPRHLTKEMKPPELIKRVSPDPIKVAGSRNAGVILLESLVDRRGDVCAARIIGKRTDAAARASLAALRQWKFRPALAEGVPVAVWFVVTVNVDVQ